MAESESLQQPLSTPVLTHVDPSGQARMVDVSHKAQTVREAVASAVVQMQQAVLDALLRGELPKGAAIEVARVAGMLAAKRTAELIPMCHPLPIDGISLSFDRADAGTLRIECTVRTTARTGVEMEALTGASVAALTIYDMAKAADRGISIGPIRLERKSGGSGGPYERITAG